MSESTLLAPKAPASLLSDPSVQAAATALVDAVRRAGRNNPVHADAYRDHLDALASMRGLPMAHPLLSGGVGDGAWVQLADGRRVLDLVSGIGPYVFGHDDQDLLETAVVAAAADVAWQGHVLPGLEYLRLSESLLRLAGPKLEHVWLSLSGSMANENAWKMILQKQAPASRVLAFEQAFHGRTLAMAELTDRPAYREGLPLRECVDRVPFYDPGDPDSTQKSVAAIHHAIETHPGQIAAMCFELVQGEGGFNDAPPEFFEATMSVCREAGLAVWVDEIQTFGRMPELFAFRSLGLDAFVDVVTIGKILHGSATLFTGAYKPRPKLVAGTWAGSTVGMALGARILQRLETEGYLGPDGGIARLTARLDDGFATLARRLPGVISGRSGLGAMQAFTAWDGRAEVSTAIVEVGIEEGILLQTAGSSPMKVRLLPPLNLSQEELTLGFVALEKTLRRVAKRFALPLGPDRRALSD